MRFTILDGHRACGDARSDRTGRRRENTVKNHVRSVMLKLHAGDRTEAVTIALRRGVIDVGG
jgi:hypothetical protein